MRILIGAAILLAGCVSSAPVVEPFTTPDGAMAFVAYCGGVDNQMTDCHEAARKQCAGNYTVIAERESQRIVEGYGSTQNRRVEFSCKS